MNYKIAFQTLVKSLFVFLIILPVFSCEKNKGKAKTPADENAPNEAGMTEASSKENEDDEQSLSAGEGAGINGSSLQKESGGNPGSDENRNEKVEIDSYTLEGLEFLKKGDEASAVDRFQKAINNNSKAYVAAYNLGVISEKQGRFEEAKKLYKQSYNAKPDYGPAVGAYALLDYKMGGSLKSALGFIEPIAKKYPSSVQIQSAYAALLVENNQIEKAMEVAKEVLKKDERNIRAMVALSRAYHKNGQNEFAKFIINQAKNINPDDAEIYLVLAELAQSAGNKKLAVSHLKKSIEINPYLIEARNNIAVLLIDGANFEEAITHLNAILKISANKGEVFLNLGEAYRGLRKWDEALDAFEKAEKLGVSKDIIYFNLALLYFSADSIKGLSKKEILLRAQSYFIKYRDEVGPKVASQEIDIDSYLKRIDKMIKIQEKIEAKAKSGKETGEKNQ